MGLIPSGGYSMGYSQEYIDKIEEQHREQMARLDKMQEDRDKMMQQQYEKAMELFEISQKRQEETLVKLFEMIQEKAAAETASVAKQVAQQTKEQNKKLLEVKKELLQELTKTFEDCKRKYEKHLTKHKEIEFTLKDEKSRLQEKFVEKGGKKKESENKNEEKSDEKEKEKGIELSWSQLRQELRSMKVIICIGKTGLGKSTFLNRLCGDTSDAGDEGDFKVGDTLNAETQCVSHKFVTLDGCKYCVVDTPGSSDTFGRDKQHTNNIAEYLRGCGGINAFLIFFSLAEDRIDATYTELLQLYTKMLDDNDWWKYVIIVATKYDTFLYAKRFALKKMNDKEKHEYAATRRQEVENFFLKRNDLNIPKGINYLPTVPIGHDNYDEAIPKILGIIRRSKFECKNIKSGIDELETQLMKSQEMLNQLKSEMDNADTNKTNMEKQVQLCKDAIDKV